MNDSISPDLYVIVCLSKPSNTAKQIADHAAAELRLDSLGLMLKRKRTQQPSHKCSGCGKTISGNKVRCALCAGPTCT